LGRLAAALANWLDLRLPLWAVLTAIVVTQMNDECWPIAEGDDPLFPDHITNTRAKISQ
jgi:hypothetical protein